MLHYVRGDGGMPVVPVEELKRWIEEKRIDEKGAASRLYNAQLDVMLAELEAMGR